MISRRAVIRAASPWGGNAAEDLGLRREQSAPGVDCSGSGHQIASFHMIPDMNGAEETGILLASCNDADVERIGIVGQDGNGKHAMHVSSCTLSSFKDVMFGDRNEGHLFVERSYYSNFRNISWAPTRRPTVGASLFLPTPIRAGMVATTSPSTPRAWHGTDRQRRRSCLQQRP